MGQGLILSILAITHRCLISISKDQKTNSFILDIAIGKGRSGVTTWSSKHQAEISWGSKMEMCMNGPGLMLLLKDCCLEIGFRKGSVSWGSSTEITILNAKSNFMKVLAGSDWIGINLISSSKIIFFIIITLLINRWVIRDSKNRRKIFS